jgi:hypothetical protein
MVVAVAEEFRLTEQRPDPVVSVVVVQDQKVLAMLQVLLQTRVAVVVDQDLTVVQIMVLQEVEEVEL